MSNAERGKPKSSGSIEKGILKHARSIGDRSFLVAREMEDSEEFARIESLPFLLDGYESVKVDELGSIYVSSYRKKAVRPSADKIIINPQEQTRFEEKRWSAHHVGIESTIRAFQHIAREYQPNNPENETARTAQVNWLIAQYLVRLRHGIYDELSISQARDQMVILFEETEFVNAQDPLKLELVDKTLRALSTGKSRLIRKTQLASALYRGIARAYKLPRISNKYSTLYGELMVQRDFQRRHLEEARKIFYEKIEDLADIEGNPNQQLLQIGKVVTDIHLACRNLLNGNILTVKPYRSALTASYIWSGDLHLKGWEMTEQNPNWQYYQFLRNNPPLILQDQEFDFSQPHFQRAIQIQRDRTLTPQEKKDILRIRAEAMIEIIDHCLFKGHDCLINIPDAI